MTAETEMKVIWVFRTGTGGARVFPSPVNAAHGQSVLFKNLTECGIIVHFEGAGPAKLEIPGGGEGRLTLPASGAATYQEYGVALHGERGTEHAEGGSRPGVIIDP